MRSVATVCFNSYGKTLETAERSVCFNMNVSGESCSATALHCSIAAAAEDNQVTSPATVPFVT